MRRIALGVAAMALLAACGQAADNGAQTPATPQPNQVDVTFAQGMIPHHQQAIEMARLIDGRTDRLELVRLAKDVIASQGEEINRMRGWLQAWGKPEGMSGMDHGGSSMPGMMGEAEMRELEGMKGTRFDLTFVDMMTRHHQGAIDMASAELREGSLAEVRQLAQQISTAQQREVRQMATWKQAWSTPSG